ncbi:MAG TPA: hypothetical protein VGL15_08335 [Vicinamibacteria bacterium]|jgi:hypothetical protein
MKKSRLAAGCIVVIGSLPTVPAVPICAATDPGALANPSTGAVRRPGGYGRLPLRFEANQGQTDSEVRFVARGSGYGLFLTPAEPVLVLYEPAAGMGASTAGAAVVR